jgi:hypothetical protein
MGKLSDALGMMGSEEAPASEADPSDMGDKKPKGGSAEVLAMKQFSRATDPEAKVQALRDLLEAMGVC